MLLIVLAFSTVMRTDNVLNEDDDQKEKPPIIGTWTETRMKGYLLNNTSPNRWLNFNNWQCNAPDNPQSAALVSYYSGDSFGERILVMSLSNFGMTQAWSYRFESNSWGISHMETGNKSLPPPKYHNDTVSVLVTVCQSNVLYIAGHPRFNSFVWLFDGQNESWSRRPVVGDTTPGPIITLHERLLYFVLFDKTARLSSSCKCCHVVVGFSVDMSVVWKLSCSDVSSKRHFVWEKTQAGSNRSQSRLSEARSLYPSNVGVYTARAAKEEGVILVIADGGLWKYDLYFNQWSILNSIDPRQGTTDLVAFFSSKDRTYILFHILKGLNNKLMLYNLDRRIWKVTRYQNPQNLVLIGYRDDFPRAVETRGSRLLLVYTKVYDCDPELKELKGTLGSTWNWAALDRPMMSPVSEANEFRAVLAVSEACFGNILYVLVKQINWPQLWELQLNTMAWVLLKEFQTVGDQGSVYWHMTVFYSSIVLSFAISTEGLQAMAYNTKNISRNTDAYLDNTVLVETLLGREDFCVAALNSSALLIYGGISRTPSSNPSRNPSPPIVYRYFSDLWVVMLPSLNSSHLQWFQLQSDSDCEDRKNSSRECPTTESLYECVVVNNTFVVFGGTANNLQLVERPQETGSCFRNVWHFSMTDYSWTHAFVDNDFSRYSRQMCITNAVAIGPQVVVTYLDSDITIEGLMRRRELWFYVVETRTWIFHSDMLSMEYFLTFTWNNYIIFLNDDLYGLSYKRLVCPPGHSSRDMSRESCALCPKGSFANGETTCTPCPPGLVTASTGSSSLSNCSFCKENLCLYGVCLVLYENGAPRSFCQCRFGFSGTHCSNPKNILITLGTIAAVGVIAFGLVYVVRLLRKRKRRERTLLHHVEELTTVWQIGNEEITQHERIGAGGNGEVYRARYRDMFVAMKVLRMPTNDSIMWEFEREIKFMQTVRHPNIVLFLGAGRTRDDSPFIISEFVSRGSLRDLLDDNSQVLSTDRTIKFCLDIAHGMNFLHSLTPPRIHRDLKSDNFLISETDVVKIADFGLGKQVPASNDCSRRDRGRRVTRRRSFNQSSDSRLPLLDLGDQDSPHAQGAARWRAPEVSVSGSQTQYTTAADVYRCVY